MATAPVIQNKFTGSLGSTSASQSVTIGAGSNQCLIIQACTDSASSIGTPTWNGSSTGVTEVPNTATSVNSNQILKIWYLVAPTQTTASYAVSGGNSKTIIIAYLLSGVDQTNPIGGVGRDSSSGTSHSTTLTTNRDNSIIISGTINGGNRTDATAGGTNQTIDNQLVNNPVALANSNQTTTTAGSYTQTFNTVNTPYGTNSIEIQGIPVANTLSIAQGSFTLSGKTITFGLGKSLIMAFGSFAITMQTFSATLHKKWTNALKNTASWAKGTKNSATFTKTNKNNSIWTKTNKH